MFIPELFANKEENQMKWLERNIKIFYVHPGEVLHFL